jgi:hypothetical protein
MRSFTRLVQFASLAFLISSCGSLSASSIITTSHLQTGTSGVVPLGGPSSFLPVANFSFSGQSSTNRVNWLSVTLTLSDGDTGVGDADYNHINLSLDGVNTGLIANGFDHGSVLTRTFSGMVASPLGVLLTSKLADGHAVLGLQTSVLSVIDKGTGGNYVSALKKCKVNGSPVFTPIFASLSFSQVPEPATLVTLSALGLGFLARRRRDRLHAKKLNSISN